MLHQCNYKEFHQRKTWFNIAEIQKTSVTQQEFKWCAISVPLRTSSAERKVTSLASEDHLLTQTSFHANDTGQHHLTNCCAWFTRDNDAGLIINKNNFAES